MRTLGKWLLAGAGLAAVPVFLAAPGRISAAEKERFLHHRYAHRGLFEKDQSIPENSLPAFLRACEAGYGIELDVQLSKDGEVVVFHDDDLKRGCGADCPVAEKTFAQLQELPLFGSEERIPLFREVLAAVDGRVPLIVELKTGKRNDELCEKTLALLQDYAGTYCIESFDPMIVAWFRRHAPQIVRGQLAMQKESYSPKLLGGLGPVLLSNTCLNVMARPHYIAYRVGKKAPLAKLSELLGAMRVGWVTHEPAEEEPYEIPIFEWYLPESRK